MIVPIISLLPRRFRGVHTSFFMTAHRTDADVAFLTVLLVRTIDVALAFRISQRFADTLFMAGQDNL